jgi:hypothetical protein
MQKNTKGLHVTKIVFAIVSYIPVKFIFILVSTF